MKFFNEMLDRMKFLQIEKLCFQQAEEILGTGIVKTVPLSAISTSVLMLTKISQSTRFYFYKTPSLNLYINNAILDTL